MAAPASGTIVLVRFPFSDLSGVKLRPALVSAQAGRGDTVLCQITSQSYTDASAIEISQLDMSKGTLSRTSFIRPGKLFTANETIISRSIGELVSVKFSDVIEAVVSLFRK